LPGADRTGSAVSTFVSPYGKISGEKVACLYRSIFPEKATPSPRERDHMAAGP